MILKLLDCVVLKCDLPEHRLRKGDVGVVVEVYTPHDFEVEFIEDSGYTRALLTLSTSEVRKAKASELIHPQRAGRVP